MLKKIVLIVIIMNLFIMTNSLAEVKDFENHWAIEEIERFVENDYIKLENNNFRPDEYMTRGEFVQLINNVFIFTNQSNLEFIDVKLGEEYYEDVLIARKQGYISGYLDNTFKPNKTISRQEAAKIFFNIMALEKVSSNLLLSYKDVSSFPDWSKEFLSSVVANDYFSGYPDGTLRPYDNIKRGEAVKMINNIIEDKPDERVYKYRDITNLGEPNLNAYDLKMLVGKGSSVIQSEIKTAADLLQYMSYVDYENTSGDIKKEVKNINWHYNEKGSEALITNDGNCGGTANLANYILSNDYEEVGIINHSFDTGQGGHVYNYIKHNGKYYIIDFLQYVMKDYNRYDYKILKLDSLEEYPPYCIRSYGGNGHDIKIIVAYEADNQIPIGNKINAEERVMRFFPKEYSDIIKVLYETPEENKIAEYIEDSGRMY